jgi:hypothetical protein
LEERVAERLVYSTFFDTETEDRSANGVGDILAILDNKRLEVNLHVATKAEVHMPSSNKNRHEGTIPSKATRGAQHEET